MAGSYNLRSPAVKRLMKEAQELREPTEQFFAQPLDDNLFEWHFTIRGPADSEFENGIYHGRIIFPPEYPMKPPSIIILTPNGRFETNKKICLSISGHHPESWQPSWSLRTALLAIIGFMPTHGNGAIGSLDYTADERRVLAKKSHEWKCPQCGSIQNMLHQVTEASRALNEEAKQLGTQINLEGEKEKSEKEKSDAAASSAAAETGSTNALTTTEDQASGAAGPVPTSTDTTSSHSTFPYPVDPRLMFGLRYPNPLSPFPTPMGPFPIPVGQQQTPPVGMSPFPFPMGLYPTPAGQVPCTSAGQLQNPILPMPMFMPPFMFPNSFLMQPRPIYPPFGFPPGFPQSGSLPGQVPQTDVAVPPTGASGGGANLQSDANPLGSSHPAGPQGPSNQSSSSSSATDLGSSTPQPSKSESNITASTASASSVSSPPTAGSVSSLNNDPPASTASAVLNDPVPSASELRQRNLGREQQKPPVVRRTNQPAEIPHSQPLFLSNIGRILLNFFVAVLVFCIIALLARRISLLWQHQ